MFHCKILCSSGRTRPLLLHPLRPVGIIGGNLLILLILLFPVEVMLPGWLNVRRFLILLSPIVIITSVYYALLTLLGQEIRELDDITEFFVAIGEFNVWFRLFFLVLVVCYVTLLTLLIFRNENSYIRWKNDNFADVDYMDITWMRYYAYFSIAIFANWIFNVILAETWTFMFHTVISIISFSYFIYKGLFYESAYPEDFFKYKSDNPINPMACRTNELCPTDNETEEQESSSITSFDEKVPMYVESFKSWMTQEKPYLYKDFKLTDVCRVLPLNRTYLSRVFNEGFGMNFCQVVRMYRVEAAKEFMNSDPNMPVYEVAERCGFSSDTTFIRAFQKEMNVTPSRYRTELKSKL